MGRIKFYIPPEITTRITVYDILGREVITLLDKKLNPGQYEIDINESGLPEGVYFCKIVTQGILDTRKIEISK